MTIRGTTFAPRNAGARAWDAAAMRLRRSLSLAVALGALAGCGSQTVHELPPAAEAPRSPAAARIPAGTVTAIGNAPEGVVGDATTAAALDGGRRVAVVSARERRLDLYDTRTRRRIGRAPAGLGPTHVACLIAGRATWPTRGATRCWSSRVGAGVEPTRRYGLPGGPYGLALDRARRRLCVTPPGPQRAGRARRSRPPPRRGALADGAPAGLGGGGRGHGRRLRHRAGGRGARARDALTRTR